jgi:cyclic dehypoxanthinyl futalosine synthase
MNLVEAIGIAERGEQLSVKAALALYRHADLQTLAQLAHAARLRHNMDPVVTYAVDRNINYTNVCISGCGFCAFRRSEHSPDSYVLDDQSFVRKLEETRQLGGTHILLQGGLNPALDLEWHEDRVRMVRSLDLELHGYSPPEILFMAQRASITVEQVLERLIKAGLGSIPGGGAEILSDRVRRTISPRKASSREWLHVMKTAHRLGLRTSATMMFGHVETDTERIMHLIRLRKLQDETGGFTAFIPWPYQPGKDTLQVRKVEGAGYLRMLAVSRLMLDNFAHVQASWVTQGAHVGQAAIFFGADDLGSTMIEENVVAAAGVSHRLDEAEMVRLIKAAGFQARQRDALYRPVVRA